MPSRNKAGVLRHDIGGDLKKSRVKVCAAAQLHPRTGHELAHELVQPTNSSVGAWHQFCQTLQQNLTSQDYTNLKLNILLQVYTVFAILYVPIKLKT